MMNVNWHARVTHIDKHIRIGTREIHSKFRIFQERYFDSDFYEDGDEDGNDDGDDYQDDDDSDDEADVWSDKQVDWQSDSSLPVVALTFIQPIWMKCKPN